MLTYLLAASLLLSPQPVQLQAGATATVTNNTVAREALVNPIVIGASMSAGYGTKGDISFASVLARTLRSPEPIASKATELFFINPLEMGSEHGDYSIDVEATIVFAVDYLFWFGYGTSNADGGVLTTEDERLELLEVGLDNLSQLDCPIVVGDFPDMSKAVGKMLLESQMPKKETLAKLTARVHEWAEERGATVVVPLASLVEKLSSDESYQVGSHRIPADSKRRLLQKDELHPTVAGLCLLAHVIADELVKNEIVEAKAVERDLLEVMKSFELETKGIEPIEAKASAAVGKAPADKESVR